MFVCLCLCLCLYVYAYVYVYVSVYMRMCMCMSILTICCILRNSHMATLSLGRKRKERAHHQPQRPASLNPTLNPRFLITPQTHPKRVQGIGSEDLNEGPEQTRRPPKSATDLPEVIVYTLALK